MSILSCSHSCRTAIRSSWGDTCLRYIKNTAIYLLHKSFFAGYDPLSPEQAANQTQLLMHTFKARHFSCVNSMGQQLDALSFQKNRKQPPSGVIVFAETTSYQDRLHKYIPHQVQYFLNCGFEVIFWNPSVPHFTTRQYAADLACILKQVQITKKATTPLLVKAHCATVEPTIHASTTLSKSAQKSVVLILDRGYADARDLARSTTMLCKISWIFHLITELFSCDGKNKLKTFAGRVILIAPEDVTADQMMYWPKTGQNLTKMMQKIRQKEYVTEDAWIGLGPNSDHWSSWDKDDYAKITSTLQRMQIISQTRLPIIPNVSQRQSISWCKRSITPLLTKSWYSD